MITTASVPYMSRPTRVAERLLWFFALMQFALMPDFSHGSLHRAVTIAAVAIAASGLLRRCGSLQVIASQHLRQTEFEVGNYFIAHGAYHFDILSPKRITRCTIASENVDIVTSTADTALVRFPRARYTFDCQLVWGQAAVFSYYPTVNS